VIRQERDALTERRCELTVVNEVGKEAVVRFWTGRLLVRAVWQVACSIGNGYCDNASTVLVIEKTRCSRCFTRQHGLSDRFIKFMLAANIRSKRLDRSAFQTPARSGSLAPFYCLPVTAKKINPTELSQSSQKRWRSGRTTRSRVQFFMNKFRKLGFIKYNGGLQINTSLLSVVLARLSPALLWT